MTWNTDRRFDAICVTGAVAAVPSRFLQWLRPGGRMFVVRGNPPVMDAALLHQDVNGIRSESLFETEIPYLVGAAPVPAFVFRSDEHTSELRSLMLTSYAVYSLQ